MFFLKKFFGRGKPVFVPEISDRETLDVSRDLIPSKVDRILRAANGGDVRDLCRLCAEILEHSPDIAQAVQTRVNAVMGCSWSFEPGDDTPEAESVSKALQKEIRSIGGSEALDNFDELLEDLMGALLPGFAISEICWENGGHIAGFRSVAQRHFTFTEGFTPRIVTREYPGGTDVDLRHVLYHRFRFHGDDPARGGLIRPLAWLHCFSSLNDKNLLAFSERYGMPFLIIKADSETFEKERNNIKKLIRNFGSSGGGLFTHGVEHELLQAANADGNIYFRLKDALANAVNQLILGQTASSGDSAGLSKGDAQSEVRQDILESDCRRLMRTINSQLCVPWTCANYGTSVPAPRFVLDYTAPEDKLATAQTLQALAGAGLQADPEEMSERFGFKLTRKTDPELQNGFSGQFGQAVPNGVAESALTLDKEAEMFGALVRAGLLTPTKDLEERIRSKMGLGALPDEAAKLWNESGGVRKPLTIKDQPDASVLEKPEKLGMSDARGKTNDLASALNEWLGPLADQMTDAAETDDDAEFAEKLKRFHLAEPGNSEKMEELMAADMRDGINGR